MAVETSAEPILEQATTRGIFGTSAAAVRLRLQISCFAPHFHIAFISGEAGSGKRMVADELHRLSGYASTKTFQALDISAFAQDLDHCKFEGVLYLTGFQRLSPVMQDVLIERFNSIRHDCRIIIASECDLRFLLAAGRIRQDLASCIGSLEIRVPPLRERIEDIEALSVAMLDHLGAYGTLSPESLQVLRDHSWPGNLAELWSVIQTVSQVETIIRPIHLPSLVQSNSADSDTRLDKVMQRHVLQVLQRCSGNKKQTAEYLGISRSTLYRMLDILIDVDV